MISAGGFVGHLVRGKFTAALRQFQAALGISDSVVYRLLCKRPAGHHPCSCPAGHIIKAGEELPRAILGFVEELDIKVDEVLDLLKVDGFAGHLLAGGLAAAVLKFEADYSIDRSRILDCLKGTGMAGKLRNEKLTPNMIPQSKKQKV